jgi:integrase
MAVTGWRGKHVKEMTWDDNVDLEVRELRLPPVPGNKKRSKLRVFPYGELPWFAALIEKQLELRLATGRKIPWVFPGVDSEPVGDFGKAWDTAVAKAGLRRLTPHVTRRSATQNYRPAGVHVRVGMDLVGHATPEMHYRYDSAEKRDRAEGVRQLAPHLAPIAGALTGTQSDTQRREVSESDLESAEEVVAS